MEGQLTKLGSEWHKAFPLLAQRRDAPSIARGRWPHRKMWRKLRKCVAACSHVADAGKSPERCLDYECAKATAIKKTASTQAKCLATEDWHKRPSEETGSRVSKHHTVTLE